MGTKYHYRDKRFPPIALHTLVFDWLNETISTKPSPSLQGTVIIIANHGDRIDIPAGSQLENKIVSGNLRILDH